MSSIMRSSAVKKQGKTMSKGTYFMGWYDREERGSVCACVWVCARVWVCACECISVCVLIDMLMGHSIFLHNSLEDNLTFSWRMCQTSTSKKTIGHCWSNFCFSTKLSPNTKKLFLFRRTKELVNYCDG